MKEEHVTNNVAMAVDEPPMPIAGRKNTIFTDETLATLSLNLDQWYRVFEYTGPDYIKMMSSLNSSAQYWKTKFAKQGLVMETKSRQNKYDKTATLYAKVTPMQEDVL